MWLSVTGIEEAWSVTSTANEGIYVELWVGFFCSVGLFVCSVLFFLLVSF